MSLNKLLDKTATLALTTDEAETLARRLARVDRQLTDDERRRIDEVAGDGTTLTSLARNLADAVDVDSQDAALRSGGEQAARKLVTDAIAPLTGNPELRKLIVEIRHQQDLTYDETTAVTVTDVVEVDRAERAREELEDWREVLTKAERDRHAAVQVALGSGSGNRSIAEKRAALRELEGKIKSGPRAWTPTVLWGHYEQLGRAAAHPGREAGLGDLIALIRYELGADDQLQPYRNVVEERFQGWLLRQRQAGVEFTAEQMWWLERIRDVIADDVGIESPELNIEPFTAQGGRGGFAATFGGRTRAQELLGELNRELG
ncbi:type I restriction-modification enzyme R subunit C-terminal domain-containing protein [Streptomyces thermocarboxydus]